MFDWIGDVFQWGTILYLVRNRPGMLLLLAGAVLAVAIAWKHKETSSEWRFNPRRVFSFALLAVLLTLISLGAYLTLWGP